MINTCGKIFLNSRKRWRKCLLRTPRSTVALPPILNRPRLAGLCKRAHPFTLYLKDDTSNVFPVSYSDPASSGLSSPRFDFPLLLDAPLIFIFIPQCTLSLSMQLVFIVYFILFTLS